MATDSTKKDHSIFYGIDLRKHGLPVVICIFLVLVIIKSFLSLPFIGPFISDELVYDKEAKILSTGVLYPHMGQQPPVYLVFLSMGYIISDDPSLSYHLMLIMGCIASSLIIFPAYFILKKYTDPFYAILGAVATSTGLGLNYFSFSLMQENLYTPLVLFSLLALIEAFDTNRLMWQIIAGASIALLEMTKSIGQMAEMAFVATFLLYLIINRNNGIFKMLKSKVAIILSFAVLFTSWHLFLANVDLINQILTGHIGKTNIGTVYNTGGITSKGILSIRNLTEYLMGVQTFLNHIDYILLASFMMLVVLLFFFITELNTKQNLGAGFRIGELYLSQLILFSIAGVTIITISLRSALSAYFMSIGRYLEPTIPAIMVIGLIYIYTVKISDFAKYKLIFVVISVIVVIFFLITNSMPNTMFSYNQIVNNPSSGFFYNMKDVGLLTLSLSAFAIVSIAFLYLALINKKYLALLLIFLIITSIVLSIIPYQKNIESSYNRDYYKLIDTSSKNGGTSQLQFKWVLQAILHNIYLQLL